MANAPFDRTIIHPREKPLSSDINQAQSQLDRSLRFFTEHLFANEATGAPSDGFLNHGFNVVPNSPEDMSVIVSKGLAFQNRSDLETFAIDGVIGLDERQQYKPVALLDDYVFTVPTAPTAPNTRIDIIEIQASYLTTDPSTRSVLNPSTGAFDPDTLNKIITWILDGRVGVVNDPANSTQPLSYKVGTEANPGVAPATTTGYMKVCEIAVGSGVTTIGAGVITDSRSLLPVYGQAGLSAQIAVNTADIATNVADIAANDAELADHETRIGKLEYNEGTRVIPISDLRVRSGTTSTETYDLSGNLTLAFSGGSPQLHFTLPTEEAERITEILLYCGAKSAAATMTFRAWEKDITSLSGGPQRGTTVNQTTAGAMVIDLTGEAGGGVLIGEAQNLHCTVDLPLTETMTFTGIYYTFIPRHVY